MSALVFSGSALAGPIFPYGQGSLSINLPVLPAPTAIQLTDADDDQLYHLQWGGVAGATRYDVARETADGVWATMVVDLPALVTPVGAEPGQGFQFRVRACTASVCGLWSEHLWLGNTGAITFSGTLVGAASSTGSYTVAWPAAAGAVLRYEVQEQFQGGAWIPIYNAAGTSVSRNDVADGDYQYRVRACYASGCGGYTAASLTVLRPPVAPAAPTVPGLSTTGSFPVTWAGVAGAQTYQLDRSPDGTNWTQIVNANALTRTESGMGNGTYRYRVRACNTSGCSPDSAISTVTVLLPPGAPAMASPGYVASGGGYALSWTASATATSYELEHNIDGGAWSNRYTGTGLSIAESGLDDGAHFYRVRACNSSGCSAWTSTAVWLGVAPWAPANLTGPAVSTGTHTISWTAVDGMAYYELQERMNGGAWATFPSTDNEELLQGRVVGGTFDYRVRACISSAMCSDYSPTITVRVNAEPPQLTSLTPVGPPNVSQSEIDASDRIGTTAGNFKVNESGAAQYSIPITVLPGTAGVTPEIALTYSSQGDNGLLGKGWAIDGLSSVTRCRQTRHQDGVAKAITWTAEDRFCLDGKRLVVVAGAYGSPGSVYNTEIDSYIRVTALGGSAGNPQAFRVERKDGSVSFYGDAPAVRSAGGALAAQPDAKLANNNGQVLTWALKKFQDSVGNPIWFTYSTDAHSQRVSQISYAYGAGAGPSAAGARIDFTYEAGDRIDPIVGYVAGHRIQTLKRLQKIDVISGAATVRTYHLSYMDVSSLPSKLSRLTSIQECAGANCLPATTFNWQTGGQGFDPNPSGSIALSVKSDRGVFDYRPADINGDGHMDLVWLEWDQDGEDSDHQLRYAVSNGSQLNHGLFTNGVSQITFGEDLQGETVKIAIVDYNADGRQDVAVYNSRSGAWNIYLSTLLADGSWRISANSIPTPITAQEADFADMDSNGLVDAFYTNGAATFPITYYSRQLAKDHSQPVTSDRYYTFGSQLNLNVVNNPSGWGSGGIRVAANADFNGDGTIDFVRHPSSGCNGFPPVCWAVVGQALVGSAAGDISVYGRFCRTPGCTTNDLSVTANVRAADFNGDGLSDIFFKAYYAQDASIGYYFAINNGDGFETAVPVGAGFNDTVSFVDYNRDGLADILWHDGDGLKVRMWNASTANFDAAMVVPIGSAVTDGRVFLDVNGDGLLDFISLSSTVLTTRLGVDAGQPRDVIVEITNGLGAKTAITYGDLANSGRYDRTRVAAAGSCHNPVPGTVPCPYNKANASDFYAAINGAWDLPLWTQSIDKNPDVPPLPFLAPLTIVTSVRSTAPATADNSTARNGVDWNASSRIDYYYAEANMQAGGRGFLGFRQVSSLDQQSGIKTVTTYRQDFPFAGYPLATTSYAPNGNIIKTSTNWWGFQNWGNNHALPPYRPVLAFSLESTYDPYASGNPLLSYVKTSNVYDAFGNATQVIVETFSDVDTTLVTRKQADNTYGATDEEKRLGRLTRAVVTHHRPGKADIVRTTAFSYYGFGGPGGRPELKGLLYQEIAEPDKAAYRLTTTHTYDSFGNHASSTVSGDGVVSRTTQWEYDALGRYRNKTINAKNQVVEQVTARNAFGEPTTVQGLNGAVTQLRYGPLGRLYLQYSNDGSYAVTLRYASQPGCPIGTVFAENTAKAGGAVVGTCHDRLGRTIRQRTLGFGGGWVFVDTEYDSLGRVKHVTEPYVETAPVYFSTHTYDALNRVTGLKRPEDGAVTTTTAYAGLTTTFTNAKGQRRIERRNAAGELIEVEDHLGGKVRYGYYADGSLHTTQTIGTNLAAGVPGTLTTTLAYDDLGRKTAMNDPDKGSWSYQYNRFGELTLQTDAKGQTSAMTYDVLGRMITRVDRRADASVEANTSWVYDTAANGVGHLDYVHESVSGYIKAMEYDSLGRVAKTGISLSANDSYFQRVSYDQYGRVYQQYDAAGPLSGTQNVYKSTGYLEAVVDPANPATEFYRVLGMTGRGMVSWEVNGAVMTVRQYSQATGRLDEIKSVVGLATVQQLNYGYDTLGNLQSRRDRSGGKDITETFGYDGLNRLTSQQATGQAAVAVAYDSFGNIKSKTGVGSYSYGNGSNGAGPHAVTSVAQAGGPAVTFTYDANGNNTAGDGRELKYTTFDKPYEITRGGHKTEMAYDPDRAYYQRVDTSGGQVTTTVFMGNVERVTKPDGSIQLRRYLPGNALLTQTYSSGGVAQSGSTQYLLKDHLGSLDVIVDHTGAVQQAMSFDAWGLRRNAGTWAPLTPSLLAAFDHSRTGKGFTGHEMLDEVGIVHMNGRIYDPRLGRFLQADTVLQFPGNLQAYNRYSYVLNNPLLYTDPSGHFIPIIAGAVAAAMELSAFQIAFVVGAASFAQTAMMGGTLSQSLRAGFLSGVSTFAFTTIGDYFQGLEASNQLSAAITADAWGMESWQALSYITENSGLTLAQVVGKVMAHAMVGGVMSVLGGDKFGHGFAAAGVTQAFSGAIGNIHAGQRFSVGRIMAAGVLGGTVSKMTGGKFANGAITGVFSRAFNDELHDQSPKRRLSDGPKLPSLPVASEDSFAGYFWNRLVDGTVMQWAAEKLSLDVGLEVAYGAGGSGTVSSNFNGDARYSLAYEKGVMFKPIGGLSADVYTSGKIQGFYQSFEVCAVGCLEITWNYRDFSIGTSIGPYGGVAFKSGIVGEF